MLGIPTPRVGKIMGRCLTQFWQLIIQLAQVRDAENDRPVRLCSWLG